MAQASDRDQNPDRKAETEREFLLELALWAETRMQLVSRRILFMATHVMSDREINEE